MRKPRIQPWLAENPDINQHHRISPSNTFLVGVCMSPEDEYHNLAVMLETHLPQIDELLMDGFWVHDVLWPVRLLLGSNYAAQCDDVGHERAVAVGGPRAGRGAAPQLWTAHPRGGPKISRSGPARE